MANIFFASDHHFLHKNIIVFTRDNGEKLRPFTNLDDMHEYIIEKHNSVVGKKDRVYFLGDVTCDHRRGLHFLDRMNGEKVLIKGNHDTCPITEYCQYFIDIRGSHQLDGILMTHIPVHPGNLTRWPINVHGHLHDTFVPDQYGRPDQRYYNVSLESLVDYTPVSLEQIKAQRRFIFENR